jgi:N,N-dimethylformamidase
MLKIVGYADRYSVAPGETIAFKLSVEEGDHFDARLLRVVHGDCNPEGPGLKFRHIPSPIDGRHNGKAQRIDAGSYLRVDSIGAIADQAFTYLTFVWPTLLTRDDQTLLAQWDPDEERGFHIAISGGCVTVTCADGSRPAATVSADRSMLERQWYSVKVAIDPATRSVEIEQKPLLRFATIDDHGRYHGVLGTAPAAIDAPLYVAGRPVSGGDVRSHFDGKIDGPILLRGVSPTFVHESFLTGRIDPGLQPSIIARWDFSREIEGTRAVDIGPSNHTDVCSSSQRAA